MTRHLVLFTSEYPGASGDAAFVANEIDTVAAAFDQVHIFSLFASERPPLRCPDNVTYEGAIFTSSRDILRRGVWSGASVGPLLREVRAHVADLRRTAAWRALGIATLIGRGMAANSDVRRVLGSHPGAPLYFYWGTGPAFVLPWFDVEDRRVVVRLHRADLLEELHGGYLPYRPTVLGAATDLVSISEHGRQRLLEVTDRLGLDATVHLNKLGTLDQGGNPSASTPEPLTIVSCSSLTPVKRVDLICDVLAEVSRSVRLNWVHFGFGPGETSLAEHVSTLQNDRFRVRLAGQTTNSDLHAFFRTSHVDCFVNLSASEGIPVSIMEALSHGIPVVATDVGGTGELVGEDKRTGILIPADADTAVMAAAILTLSSAPRDTEVKVFWEKEHSAARQASAMVAILQGS